MELGDRSEVPLLARFVQPRRASQRTDHGGGLCIGQHWKCRTRCSRGDGRYRKFAESIPAVGVLGVRVERSCESDDSLVTSAPLQGDQRDRVLGMHLREHPAPRVDQQRDVLKSGLPEGGLTPCRAPGAVQQRTGKDDTEPALFTGERKSAPSENLIEVNVARSEALVRQCEQHLPHVGGRRDLRFVVGDCLGVQRAEPGDGTLLLVRLQPHEAREVAAPELRRLDHDLVPRRIAEDAVEAGPGASEHLGEDHREMRRVHVSRDQPGGLKVRVRQDSLLQVLRRHRCEQPFTR